MRAPTVSVMLASYNQASYVEQAIDSVLGQDYPHIELVVADDGSTDGTAELVARRAEQRPDVIVPVLAANNQGMHRNFNQGLARCTGDLVAFHAGDDLYLPGKLSAQVRWFQESPTRVLCGHDVGIFVDGAEHDVGRYSDHFPMRAGFGAARVLREGVLFSGTSVMIRRDALPVGGYDEQLKVMSDWKLHVQVLAGGGEYGFVPGVLARYRRHGRSVTADITASAAALNDVLADRIAVARWVHSEHPEYACDAEAMVARAHLRAARASLLLGERQIARRHASAAVAAQGRVLPAALPVMSAALLPAGAFDRALAMKRRLIGTTRSLGERSDEDA